MARGKKHSAEQVVNPQRDAFRDPHGRVASLKPRGGASDLYNARFFL